MHSTPRWLHILVNCFSVDTVTSFHRASWNPWSLEERQAESRVIAPFAHVTYTVDPYTQSSAGGTSNEDVEEIVRQRVAEELKRLQEQESQREYDELAKANIDKDYNSVAMGTDIQTMIDRIKR